MATKMPSNSEKSPFTPVQTPFIPVQTPFIFVQTPFMATKMPSNSEKSPFTLEKSPFIPVQTPFMATPTHTIPKPIKIPEVHAHPLIIYVLILIVCFRMLNGISELLGVLVAINGVCTGIAWRFSRHEWRLYGNCLAF